MIKYLSPKAVIERGDEFEFAPGVWGLSSRIGGLAGFRCRYRRHVAAVLLLLATACGANVEEPTDPDAGSPTLCKVSSDCGPAESCNWKSIATYNPNVPGGFSGECIANEAEQ